MAHAQHSPFQPRAEVSFPRARQYSEYNGKEASASFQLPSKIEYFCVSMKSQNYFFTILIYVLFLSRIHERESHVCRKGDFTSPYYLKEPYTASHSGYIITSRRHSFLVFGAHLPSHWSNYWSKAFVYTASYLSLYPRRKAAWFH